MAQRGTREFCDAIPGVFPATIFVYDGDLLLGEVGTDGTPLAAYTWGAAGLISRRDLVTNTTYWYHFGPQGETRQITNSTGMVVGTYDYNAYGALTGSTGTGAGPFQYGGQFGYYTDLGGFVLCGARWYEPRLGRWLSRDPIDYAGGDNLYAYCLCNPVGLTDPSGLDSGCSMWGQLRSWDTWRDGLTTSAAAFGHTVSMGLWDGGSHREDPGFNESVISWRVAEFALGAAKVAAKFAAEAGTKVAVGIVKAAKQNIIVIGKNPVYKEVAKSMEAKYFNMHNDVFKMLGQFGQKLNLRFLKKYAVNRRYRVFLSNSIEEANAGSGFRKEVDYLLRLGFKLSEDGKWLVRP